MSEDWVPVGALVVHSGHVSHTHALGSRGRRAFLNRCQMHAKMTQRQTAKDYKRFLFLFDTPARDKSLMVRGSGGGWRPKGAVVQKAKRSCCCINYTTLQPHREGQHGGKGAATDWQVKPARWGRSCGVFLLGFLGRSTRITRTLHHCTTAPLHHRRLRTSLHQTRIHFNPLKLRFF